MDFGGLAEWAKDKPLSILQLDPADRAVLKIADERDAVQKKTFTKWVNKHLKKSSKHVEDLFEDLRDGHNLISLLEVLSGELLPRERGRMRFHMLQNVQIALDFLRYRKIKLVNIRAEDIVDGNPKLTLGLIWTIILHFQISDIITGQTDESITAREALLRWAQRTTDRYPGVKVVDFTNSWRDGLAFNAILHRNRPDIMDFRSLRNRTARDNLEHAFTLAEREFAVTKLLDPEDVDTPEPDEKSLITYISSLYDVFPMPPSYNPFADEEKHRKIEDYKDLASTLLLWMRESTHMLQDRHFPNTLHEMKSLLSDCTRFRVEDIPPRQHDKQRLAHMYRELKKSPRDPTMKLDTEFHFDSIERKWNRLMTAHQERDQAIHDEIARLEKLQRLAEKVHREAKQCDSKLDDIERRIAEEEKRFQRLHPMDAKHNCDQIEAELKHVEDSIKSMSKDVQTLKDGRHHQAHELQRRVQHLHERWVSIRLNFQSRLVNPLSTRSFKTEEKKVTKQRHVVSEQRLVETNEAFRFLQECIDWVNSKLKFLDQAEYGSDLPSVQLLLDQHQTEHKLIEQFQRNIDQCDSRKSQFKDEEHSLYCKLLNRLQKGYSELLIMSNKRLSDLETLQDFIQSATNELIWMNEKEEVEVSRDWSAKNLNLVDTEQYQEALTSDLERREIQFNSVQDRGESLVLQKHPAAKCIEAYLAAMQTQWNWLLQLILCLQTHLRHASSYHQFFTEAHECEQWLKRIEEKLNTTYSRQTFSIDEGERLLKEMQNVRQDLTRYGTIVSQLIDRSKEVVPLKQRRQPLPRPLRVNPICSYKQLNMSISKDEQCWLHDNSQKVKWKVINSSGTEGMVPGVCFVIPPPNLEAIDLAESLKKRFDMVVQLWAKKQHKLRLNMIFATIKIVKSWTLDQFRAMEPSQREAIMKALNEDADKLLSEGDRNDPALKRLEEEIANCNKLFRDLMARLREEEEEKSPKSPTRRFNDLVGSLQPILSEKERTLTARIQAPIPRDLGTLEVLVIEHKEFESELQALEPQINEAKHNFQKINRKTPVMQTRHDNLMDTWNRLWDMSHMYIERLKAVEISLHGIDEATRVVSSAELQLAAYDEMPSDLESLEKVHSNLQNLREDMENQQHVIDQLGEDSLNVRRLTERSRPKQSKHPDVNRLEDDCNKLVRRWDNACSQIADRMRSCEASSELLRAYKNKLNEEKPWINEMEVKVKTFKSVKTLPLKDAEKEMHATMEVYQSLADKKASIEQANVMGGRFIREAKLAAEENYRVCGDNISKFTTWLSEMEQRLAELGAVREDANSLQRQVLEAQNVKDNLEDNQPSIMSCLDQVRQVVQQGQDMLSKEEIQQIQKDADALKKRYDATCNHSDRLLHLLSGAFDELQKFTTELNTFTRWLNGAVDTLVEKEQALGDLSSLKGSTESIKTFVSDVIAHQADLRFITMAAQKFLDESKDYMKALNDFRTNLPRRLSHVEFRDGEVKAKVEEVTEAYQKLFARVNRLNDAISTLGDKQRHYSDCVEKATSWLSEARRQAKKLLDEPVGSDMHTVQDQLDRVKVLSMDIVSQGRLIENVKQAARTLLESMEATGASRNERQAIEDTVRRLESDYQRLSGEVHERSNDLQTALVQCQDIQDGLDRLLRWLDDAESNMRNQSKPVSLIQEKLEEQYQDYKIMQSEIDSQKPAINAMNASARDLSSSNQRLAKKIEARLKDVNSRFEKLNEKAGKRRELLEDVSRSLEEFGTMVNRFDQWLHNITEAVDNKDLSRLSAEAFAAHLEDAMNQRNAKRGEFDEMIRTGKNLVAKRDVTDTTSVKDKIKTLEQQWKELGDLLAERQKVGKSRAEQMAAYETLRTRVLEWLHGMESKVDKLEPVAVDREALRRQATEIKPLVKEHADYSITIDKVNDLGNAYDATLRGDSPVRSRKKTTPTPSSPTRKSPPNLSPIQQQLSEINNRYQLLGVKLNDRQQEIDTLSVDVKNHLETLKILSAFVQAKERLLPKDLLPSNKEQADKYLQILKEIMEEMQEKQSSMDRLKTQTNDLLKRKPNVEGSTSLRQQVTDVAGRWTEMNSFIKERLAFLQDLKDFQDTHDLLNNWLVQKDKMFHVLGPIASEPRMVNAQMQQVLVMRDELSSQQPLMSRMDNSGTAVLEKMDASSSSAKKIREQMTAIHKKWADLVAQLQERERSLDAASGATKDFHDRLRQLQARLQHISDEFDQVSEGGTDTDEQLRKLNELDDQLESQRPLLADAESGCEQLCEILNDSASKSEIKSQLAAVEKQYTNLCKKINNRKAELESSRREDKDFYLSCDGIQRWLNDTEITLAREVRISADHDRLKRQLQEFEPIYRDILDKEHEVHLLLGKGADMVNKMGRKADAAQLRNKLDTIKKQWEKIRKGAIDRHTRLQGCMENCKKFHNTMDIFVPWLEATEDKINNMKPISFKRSDLDKQLKEVQGYKNELSRHSQEFENVRVSGENLVAGCDTDKEAVKDHLDRMRKRWDRMNHEISERNHALENIAQKLLGFQEQARDVQHSLQRLEDKLTLHDGDSEKDPKLLNKMKALLSEAGEIQRHLHRLKDTAEVLVNEAMPGSDTSHITDEVDALDKRHKQLTQKLEDRCADLESASEIVAVFNSKMRTAHHDLNSFEEELDGMGPIARDVDELSKQTVEIQDFEKRLLRARDGMHDAEQQCKEIIKQGFTPDPKGCKDQMDNLKRQLNRLEERAKTRENNLEDMTARVQRFYDDYTNASRELKSAINEEKSFRPIGGEVEVIRAQQQEFKSFHHDRIEPLSKRIEEVNKIGQGLVQSASSGVDTSRLEQDLDKLNDKWNNLKEKLSDRERRLDFALLQSGRFQEALAGVEKWLQDTEEMVANQKPPSADYKVVKAQLQEQKFLNKLLLDRQGSMSSLMSMGTEVMKNLEPSERGHIDRQLKDLGKRFDILTSGAHDRMDALERTLPIAREFLDRMIPLTDWLERTAKKLGSMATVPTDKDKLRRRVAEHRALHEDILDHKGAFEELTEVAQTLMGLVGDDEAQVVVEKLQEITDNYAKIVEESERIGQLLSDTQEGIGAFVLNFEDMLAWIDEMDSRLSRFQILSVFVDKLREQIDELTEVREEVSDHHKQVSVLINSGQDIMKHASGDDAIQIKDKLDTLRAKYTDLTNRAEDRLKHAHDALPLVRNFHTSYDKLSVWMDDAERALKTLETTGLHAQETTIQRLETQVQEYRPLLESINHLGPQLCHISPGEGSAIIESSVSRANRRFDAICEQVQRKAERIELSKQRNVEVVGDIDDLLEWFREAEKQLLEAEPIVPNPKVLAVLLKEQKAFNEEVSSQKGRVRDILSAAKKLMRESSSEDLVVIRDKAEDLKETAATVSALCAERLAALEQALPLAEHFNETHAELSSWMDEVESEADMLTAPVISVNQIKKYQEKTKALMQSVADHKPLVDKLNKTGNALIKLCMEEDGAKVQSILDLDNQRYSTLRNLLREKQNALEEALQDTSQFADKLDGMLNSLSSTADQLNNAEPISAHPEKIQEQISDNKAILQDLDKKSSALAAVKKAANDVINKAGDFDEPAIKDIRKKLDRLNNLWDNIQKDARKRGRSLDEALAAAERFWEELTAVMQALKELQENLNAQEPPAVEPNAIQQQQEVLQEIKQEINQTKPEVDHCRQAGQDLMQLCGEPDKPEVKKHIEDLDSAWENVTTLYAKREQNLIDAMEKAMSFHDTLQNLLEFLDSAEEKLAHLGPVASDIDAVKGQISQLKSFKNEVDPHMIEVEALNRQAQELMERTSPEQATAIREPMDDINHRWDDLLKGIVERQRELENSLLRLGQFQHALDELLSWIGKTEKTLEEIRPVFGDPQVIEVELAKHKVLMNDIHSHQTSVDTLNRAGRQLIDSDRGSEDANVTQKKLGNLNSKWHQLQDKASQRQKDLEEALKEAQIFNQEIQDLLVWLSDIDGQLVTSKPVGGLPETAREQLNRFMELFNELDSNRHKVESVLSHGQDYLKRSTEGAATNLQHNLKTLKQRWDNVLNRANDRKIKLEIALREATEFHEALQEFVEWLTSAEKYLGSLKPVSRVMDTVLEQIDEHKAFQKDVGAHREVMLNLDKKGTHLKYFSQKQDVILIKNLLISVQHRWERAVSKAAERTRALDHGYKEAKEFHDAWSGLTKWLDEAEQSLDSTTHIGNNPEKIKQMLAKHKEFQRTLGAKQPTYDGTMRQGRVLKDRSPKADVPVLQNMLDELKNKWNSVCAKSVDRQRKLEEALLFSGQFKDAVQALIDWLDKAQSSLSQDQPLHGDLDTVMALVDQHKNFEEELRNRSTNMESVRRTANELLQTASPEDAKNIRVQLSLLEDKWESVVRLSDKKRKRLEEALKQAEQLHKAVHMLLEWLSDAEMKLRFAGPLPEDEETTKQQIADHQKFMREMADQESNKDKTIALAQEILQKCHPDAVSVIRHWITIIQSRWEEVALWAKQREQRLLDHLRSLKDIMQLLEELMAWLILAEANLTALEAEPLPDDLPTIEQLIKEHQVFMDEMSKKQPDVEQVTKAFTQKRPPQQQQATPRDKAGKQQEPHDRRRAGLSQAHPRTSTPVKGSAEPEIKNARARELLEKWRHVWLLAMERQRRLQDKYNYLKELERIKNFDFDEWRRRFLGWMNNKKSRIMDLFRKIDKDNDGKVTIEDFIDGILKSKFPTSRMEMEKVADIFDRNGDGFIDHKEYIETLRPDREGRSLTEAEKIQDEVQRQVAKCTCAHRFKVYQVGEGKYRFGESQKLRLVRILRSTVMVRVGGGWVALDEFLVKNDPCRAKGRTNLELREQFILAEGVSQSMTPFKPKPSPNSSLSSQSGTSFSRPSAGPITKVREKSERSVPMRQRRTSGPDTSSDLSGPSFSETDSAKSARSRPTPNRLAPPGPGNRPPSRTTGGGSRPSSRPSSRPPSRAGSDLSTESVEAYRGRRTTPGGTTRSRTPSQSSQTSGKANASTKIPTVKRSSSSASASGRPSDGVIRGREVWK